MPVSPVSGSGGLPAGAAAPATRGVPDFAEVLRLSAHAAERLKAAGRELAPAEMAAAGHGVRQAADKGAHMALVLLGSLALVVSVNSRTVVTAVDGARMGQGIFTGIDSAVIAKGPDPEA